MRKETCNLLILGKEDVINSNPNNYPGSESFLGFETENRFGDKFTVCDDDGTEYIVGYDSTHQCYFVESSDNTVYADNPEELYIQYSDSPEDIVDWFKNN